MILLQDVVFAAGNGGLISQIAVMMIAVFASAYFLKNDVETGSIWSVFILSVVIIILNKTIGAILHWFATPFEFITLGLFSFVVNAIVIRLAEYFVSSFRVRSFWTAVLMAVIIAIVSVVTEWIF